MEEGSCSIFIDRAVAVEDLSGGDGDVDAM
jgi:hypothetical protein